MKQRLSIICSLLFTWVGMAQSIPLTNHAEISVLTIGPGDNLNDAFGHNAFRIKDHSVGMDLVYGYGEYDFESPNFYLKFAQGKLHYQMSENSFSDFYRFYKYYNRSIEEQVLQLSQEEKQALYNYLVNNYKPENRKYLYDFFYDNCATRIRDVVEIAIDKNITFKTSDNFQPKTFRRLIHDHTGRNTWGSFGIDVALGSVIDKKATAYEHLFLPKYIHEFFGNATFDSGNALVKTSSILYQRVKQPTAGNFITSPLMIIGLLSVLIIYITYTDKKKKTRSRWLDLVLFSTTGLIGILIGLLWFATDHSATAYNYNLLWAFPLNLLILGSLLKTKVRHWVRNYLKFLVIMLCLMTLHWMMGIQVFAIGLIPFLIALTVRYLFLISYYKKTTNFKIH